MGRSKVVYGTETLIDLTEDSVTAAALLSGYTAHDKAGEAVAGTLSVLTVYTGSGAPDDTLGADGDIYLDLG
jgi:hypothetical protein